MTRDQAILLILSRLGQRQDDVTLQAAAVLEMNAAQERLEHDRFKPWFLLSELQSINTTANEERIALPVNFLEEPEEGALWRIAPGASVPRVELIKDDYDVASARYPVPGVPLRYSLTGSYIRLHPTPNAVYQLQSQFYLSQPQITEPYLQPGTVVTNAWLTYASDWLICETGRILAELYTRDQTAAASFANGAGAARNRVYTETVARAEANAGRQMGEN